jgi:hypothetical protein
VQGFANESGGGPDGNDAAPVLPFHSGHDFCGEMKEGLQVEIEHLIQALGIGGLDTHFVPDPGVMNENVDGAQSLSAVEGQAPQIVETPQIRLESFGFSYGLDRRLGVRNPVQAMNADPGSSFSKLQRDGQPDAA